MVVVSKEVFFDIFTKDNNTCSFWHYWTPSCTTAFLSMFPKVLKGATTFFMPIYLIRLAMDYRMKKENLGKRALKRVLRTTLYGMTMGGTLISMTCLIWKLIGLHFYTVLFLPGFISATSILFESEENQTLNTLIFFNSFLESCLNALRLSTVQQTVLFMAASGILMQLFENRKKEIDFTYLWYYTPKLRKHIDSDVENKHDYSKIGEYSLQGVLKYSLIGAGINMTKRLLGKFGVIFKDPKKILSVFFHKSNLNFGLFIGAYVGLYRAMSSYLKLHEKTKIWRGLISGIISGVTFMYCPTIQVIVMALTTILQILYHQICTKYKITNHFYQRLLLFQFSHGINIHNKFFNEDICSPYYDKMIDACTDNLTLLIKRNVILKNLPKHLL